MKSSPSDSIHVLNFSQLQPEQITNDLRREIWNAIRELLLSLAGTNALYRPYFFKEDCRFIERVLGKLSKKSGDKIDTSYEEVLNQFRALILEDSSNKVIQLVKIMAHDREHGEKFINHISESSESLKIIENPTRISEQAKSNISQRKSVFIGHGRSPIWRELKDFITDRLKLPVDEFNRVPVAGLTNVERLRQMLDTASIAFLIMTGEDEQPDGKLQARMNVVHEAGLFQGRLGFSRAIIVLEKGCEEFSNIEGLGQIRFTKGNIKEAFEEIRQVLEREELLPVNS